MARFRLKVMADYSAFPVWDVSDTEAWQSMVSPERLPISERLRADLVAWADVHDRSDPFTGDWPDETPIEQWENQGRDLADKLQQELGADYEVFFFEDPAAN